jgi:hypothetical protein
VNGSPKDSLAMSPLFLSDTRLAIIVAGMELIDTLVSSTRAESARNVIDDWVSSHLADCRLAQTGNVATPL